MKLFYPFRSNVSNLSRTLLYICSAKAEEKVVWRSCLFKTHKKYKDFMIFSYILNMVVLFVQ